MAKPIPEKVIGSRRNLPTNERSAHGTGIDNGEAYGVQGHADLQTMAEPYSARRAAFNPHGEEEARRVGLAQRNSGWMPMAG